jgi:hypothetical protein
MVILDLAMAELHHFLTDLLLLPGLWFLFRVGLGIKGPGPRKRATGY